MYTSTKDKNDKGPPIPFGKLHAFYFYECRGGNLNGYLIYAMTCCGRPMNSAVFYSEASLITIHPSQRDGKLV